MSPLQLLFISEIAGFPITEAEAQEYHDDYVEWQKQVDDTVTHNNDNT